MIALKLKELDRRREKHQNSRYDIIGTKLSKSEKSVIAIFCKDYVVKFSLKSTEKLWQLETWTDR